MRSSSSQSPYSPMRSIGRAAIAAGAVFAFLIPATTTWSFPWDIDMYRGAPVQPLAAAPRDMPPGTLPMNDAELPSSREYMTVHEHNPLSSTPEDIAKGKALFATDCAACHGDSGRGDGPVAHLLKTKPKDLVGGVSKSLPDGYIYGTIRDGGVTMPSYGDAMSEHERWQVVLFVRSLQQSAVATK